MAGAQRGGVCRLCQLPAWFLETSFASTDALSFTPFHQNDLYSCIGDFQVFAEDLVLGSFHFDQDVIVVLSPSIRCSCEDAVGLDTQVWRYAWILKIALAELETLGISALLI